MILLEAFFGDAATAKGWQTSARTIRDEALPDGGWSQYPGRPRRALGLVPQLLRAEGRGRRRGRAPHAAGARRDLAPGRRRARQHLHASTTWPCSASTRGAGPGHPARDDVPAPAWRRSPSTTCRAGRARSSCRCRSCTRTSPCARCRPACGVAELFAAAPRDARSAAAAVAEALFFAVDSALKSYRASCPAPACAGERRRAAPAAWMIDRLEGSDGLSAILPAMANSAMALKCLGYDEDHPLMQGAARSPRRALLRDATTGRCACSPACRRCGTPCWPATRWRRRARRPDHPALRARPPTWLLAKQCRRPGDWATPQRRRPRAAGTSSTATSSIPTSTTPAWR